MNGRREVAAIRALITGMCLTLIVGCASVPPKTSGGKTTPYFVSCNAPGAQVLTEKGNIVGECPVKGEIEWEGWDKWWSPYGEMIEVERIAHPYLFGTHYERKYYFVGKIVAPGYRSKAFRVYIGSYRQYTDAFRDDLVARIAINAYLEPASRPVGEQPSPQQQQQQQQQTVIVPGTGASEAVARGMVMVSSTPENAEVYLDGAFVGNSPANLKLSEGIHIVEVRKTGFKSYKKELRVIGSSELNLRVTLEKE